jgi:hypothetical protein
MLVLGALALAGTFAGAAAAEEPAAKPESGTMKLDIRSEDGSKVQLEISSGWIGALLSHSDIDCDGRRDRRTREMMSSLDGQGEGGVWKGRDDDGDRVLARRSRGMLKLESADEDGDLSTVEMPWEVAQCLLAGIEPAGDLGRRIASGEARIAIDLRDDGGRVSFRIE